VNVHNLRPIKFGPPGEDIDKKDLLAVIRRFQNLHKLQLQRIQASLPPRQRDFLPLLPLLFHTNHPLLPGFISSESPAGIADYVPGRQALQCAERLSRSFEFKRRALQSYPIHGIYLMGSVGSIAYSNRSDLDIWLCHESGLDAPQLQQLKEKALAVEAWATTLGLEVHIFFINAEDFRNGVGEPISTESCGSIQHHLLLEEFYRTSLYIAGRVPAWWLVPPEQDGGYARYLRHLKENRFINERDVIDLGGMENVSAEEFLGGALWHLYKAISAPHKSLLKLLLMECYASEYPSPEWLCSRLKAAIHGGNMDVNELDSYILMYRKVESYLFKRDEAERLDLARQCFYLKINELLSMPAATTVEKQYRRDILETMISAWAWPEHRLQELDGRRRWRIGQILDEQKRVSRELNQSYQSITGFAREYVQHVGAQNDEITLLGRRLFAALERKPGKVEILSRDGCEEIEPEDFSLEAIPLADGEDGWMLYAGKPEQEEARTAEPLKRARSLVDILAWLIVNGFYRSNMTLALQTGCSTMTAPELRNNFNALVSFLRRKSSQNDDLDAYARPSRVEASALFVNIGYDASAGRKDGLQIASSRFDALSFGASRVSLIRSIDQINLTSWQEILVYRHMGLTGLFDSLCELMNKSAGSEAPPILECFSFSSSRSRSIAIRIQQLYQDLTESLQGSACPRYIVRGGSEFYIFERKEGITRYWNIPDEAAILAELARPRPRFGPVAFDRAALEASPLPHIYAKNKRGLIQIFCIPGAQQMEVFILDERGSLFHRIHPPANPELLLGPYAMFINAMQQRYVTTAAGFEYYLLEFHPRGGYKATRFDLKPNGARKLIIRVFGLELASGRTAYSIFCNEREFSSMDSGQDLFSQVAAHILQLRRGGEHYPIYITDIDVPPAVLGADALEQLQTIHFLNYKQKIEERLNR